MCETSPTHPLSVRHLAVQAGDAGGGSPYIWRRPRWQSLFFLLKMLLEFNAVNVQVVSISLLGKELDQEWFLKQWILTYNISW